MPAIKLNANDIRRGSGGTALRWLRISATNDAQISTKHAYAKVMGRTPYALPSRLFYRSLGSLAAHIHGGLGSDTAKRTD